MPPNPFTGDYEFVIRLKRTEEFSDWYARTRRDEPGLDSDTRSRDVGIGPGARVRDRSAEKLSRRTPAVVEQYLRTAERRLAAERLIRLYAAPDGDPLILGDRVAEWSAEVGRTAASLRHPHLLHVFEARADDPLSPMLVCEFPEGGCLEEVLTARDRLSIEECASVVSHVCRAVAWLHSQDLPHGAIEPGRVYFTRNSQALLAPPLPHPWDEHASDDVAAQKADDVRDIAALVWRMMTGRDPGDQEHRVPLPLMCPGTSRHVVRVLEEALDPDPAVRPRLQEVVHVFRGATEIRPVDLHPSARPEFAGRLPGTEDTARKGGRRRIPGSLSAPRTSDTAHGNGDADGPSRRRHRASHAAPNRHGTVPRGLVALRGLVTPQWQIAPRGPKPRWRGILLVTVVVLALGGAVSAGARWIDRDGVDAAASAETRPEADTAGEEPSPGRRAAVDPAAAVRDLVETRDQALRERSTETVAHYAVAGTALARADRRLIDDLIETGTDWSSLRSDLSEVEVSEHRAGKATVRARMSVTGHREPGGATPSGTVDDLPAAAAADSQRIAVRLAEDGDDWKIASVSVVPD